MSKRAKNLKNDLIFLTKCAEFYKIKIKFGLKTCLTFQLAQKNLKETIATVIMKLKQKCHLAILNIQKNLYSFLYFFAKHLILCLDTHLVVV